MCLYSLCLVYPNANRIIQYSRLRVNIEVFEERDIATTTNMENHEETVIKKRKIPKPIINDTDQSMITFLVAILKKVAIAGVIYLIGYMNWSVAWILTPIILTESQKLLRESNVVKRKMVKDSAKGREKDVILARVKDLPAWVLFILLHCTIYDRLLIFIYI